MLGATILMASDTSDVDVYGDRVKLRLRNANENDGEGVLAQVLYGMVLLRAAVSFSLLEDQYRYMRYGNKQALLLYARNISQGRVGDVRG